MQFDPVCHIPGATRYVKLSPREADILRCLCKGFTDRQIGEELKLSPGVVHGHLSRLSQGLQISGRGRLMLWALEREHHAALECDWVPIAGTPVLSPRILSPSTRAA